MTMERLERIYIKHLNTKPEWVGVDAIHVSDSTYRILASELFDDFTDPQRLFEYYPEDVVLVAPYQFNDGSFDLAAIQLVKAGDWPNRRLNEFLLKAYLKQIEINNTSLEVFADELAYVWQRKENGEDFYPEIVETLNALQRFKLNNGDR